MSFGKRLNYTIFTLLLVLEQHSIASSLSGAKYTPVSAFKKDWRAVKVLPLFVGPL